MCLSLLSALTALHTHTHLLTTLQASVKHISIVTSLIPLSFPLSAGRPSVVSTLLNLYSFSPPYSPSLRVETFVDPLPQLPWLPSIATEDWNSSGRYIRTYGTLPPIIVPSVPSIITPSLSTSSQSARFIAISNLGSSNRLYPTPAAILLLSF
jgi:hypothetical protein